ncbi:MAG: hypothetical protein ACI9RO_000029 [Alteromonas macleodii]|jgi:hypothetical protein
MQQFSINGHSRNTAHYSMAQYQGQTLKENYYGIYLKRWHHWLISLF